MPQSPETERGSSSPAIPSNSLIRPGYLSAEELSLTMNRVCTCADASYDDVTITSRYLELSRTSNVTRDPTFDIVGQSRGRIDIGAVATVSEFEPHARKVGAHEGVDECGLLVGRLGDSFGL